MADKVFRRDAEIISKKGKKVLDIGRRRAKIDIVTIVGLIENDPNVYYG
jgi:hypothetical protein